MSVEDYAAQMALCEVGGSFSKKRSTIIENVNLETNQLPPLNDQSNSNTLYSGEAFRVVSLVALEEFTYARQALRERNLCSREAAIERAAHTFWMERYSIRQVIATEHANNAIIVVVDTYMHRRDDMRRSIDAVMCDLATRTL